MNEVVDHWVFFEPDWYLTMLGRECLSKEILEIFYIARSIFSTTSLYKTRDLLNSVFKREKLAQKQTQDCPQKEGQDQKQSISDHVTISKISSIGQIAAILPREFLINNNDLIFYKKLVNRELHRRDFEAPEEDVLSVSELIKGQDRQVNRAQKIYLLFDNSSSMRGEEFNKLYASKAIALEYLRKVQPENPQIYFRSFTDKVSPLMRTEKAKDVKKIIKQIANLRTRDCRQTEIGQAILRAVEDIHLDHRLKKAEILVITDGLGPIPKDVRDILGEIKLHVILICGVNIEQILKLYPNRQAWKQAGLENAPRKMPAFWDAYGQGGIPFSLPDSSDSLEAMRRSRLTTAGNQTLRKLEVLLSLSQIYQLQEAVDTFISLPSMLGEKFNLFNSSELDWIVEYRKKLEKLYFQDLPLQRKSEIYQRVQFMLKYLNNLLGRKPPKDAHRVIKLEIANFIRLKQSFLKDPWFTSSLESLADRGEPKNSTEAAEKFFLDRSGNRKGHRRILAFFIEKTIRLCHRIGRVFHLVIKDFCNYWSSFWKRRRLNRLQHKMQGIIS